MNSLRQDRESGLWAITDLPVVTIELQEAASISVPRIEARLVPTDAAWISGAVATLLTHFYTADLPKAAYAAINADWVACLAEFPSWAIEKARLDWLKTERRKPTPSDIVRLCNRAVSKERITLMLCKRIMAEKAEKPKPEMTAAEREANKAQVTELVAGLISSLRYGGAAENPSGP